MSPAFSAEFLDELAKLADKFWWKHVDAWFDGIEGAGYKRRSSGSKKRAFLDYASAIGQENRLATLRLAEGLTRFLLQVRDCHPDLFDGFIRNASREGWSWENNRLVEVVTNQGRVRSTNVAAIEEDGLLFRSRAEICVYGALLKKGLPFAPLPVFLRGDGMRRRIEPDFVLLIDGRLCIIEVDGVGHRTVPAIDEQQRIQFLAEAGAEVIRINAPKDDDEAEHRVLEALQYFARRKQAK